MTTAALTTLLLTGLAVGLLAQFLTVHYRLEPQHDLSTYLGMGIVGVGGALFSIPLMMLLDYGRGGSGSESLHLIGPVMGIASAALALLFAKALDLGDRRVRFGQLVLMSTLWALLVLMIMFGRA